MRKQTSNNVVTVVWRLNTFANSPAWLEHILIKNFNLLFFFFQQFCDTCAPNNTLFVWSLLHDAL